MKIIFMGTPAFALPTLQALHQAGEHTLLAVYCQPARPAGRGYALTKSPVQLYAESQGIPVYHPLSLKDEKTQQEFAALAADIAVVAAYGLLLPPAILNAPKYGCINIHPSALPRWRGAAPIQRPIMAGDTTTEMCIMQMDVGLDTGAVWLRQSYDISADANAGYMHDMLSVEGAKLTLQTLNIISGGTAHPVPQISDGVTYAAKITKEEAQIDWQKTAEQLHHHIRGLSPTPGAWTRLNGEIFKILQAEISSEKSSESLTGTVVSDDLQVACGQGVLRLLRVQKAGKPVMPAAEFLRGQKISLGEKLG